ncbi:MAG: ABC transporter permease [Bacteroidota bacterium]
MLFQNYWLSLKRNLRKYWQYTSLNILSMTLALTFVLLTVMYLFNEFSYDSYHEKSDRIYRVTSNITDRKATVDAAFSQPPFGYTVADSVEEIENYATLIRYRDFSFMQGSVKDIPINMCFFTSPSTLQVFDWPLVLGEQETALQEPMTVIISESVAERYFRDSDPIGQKVAFNKDNDLTITGVFSVPEHPAHFTPEVLISYSSFNEIYRLGPSVDYMWGTFDWTYNYLLLAEGAEPTPTFQKASEVAYGHLTDYYQNNLTYDFEKLTDIHLHADHLWEIEENGNFGYVVMFIVLCAVLLLVASISYINLEAVQSQKRTLEVGLRKSLGASSQQIRHQFLFESTFYSLLSILPSILLGLLIFPWFQRFLDINLPWQLWNEPWVYVLLIVFALVMGLTSGSYPAIMLNRFRPAEIFSSGRGSTSIRSTPRLLQGFVLGQMVISLAMVITVWGMRIQKINLGTHALGLNPERVYTLHVESTQRRYVKYLKDSIAQIPGVEQVGSSSFSVAEKSTQDIFRFESGDSARYLAIEGHPVDSGFKETLGLQILAGRNFMPRSRETVRQAVLVNETLARKMGWEGNNYEDALGKAVGWPFRRRMEGTVVGVVKDFHVYSLHNAIQPSILVNWPQKNHLIYFKLAPGADKAAVLASMEAELREYLPDTFFWIQSLEADFQDNYAEDLRTGQLLSLVSTIIIIITLISLFAMASLSTQQRVAEIAIRKVLGANSGGLFTLLSQPFLLYIAIGGAIALPAAFAVLYTWIHTFVYQVPLQAGFFAWPWLAALALVMVAVGWVILRTIRLNPVESISQ